MIGYIFDYGLHTIAPREPLTLSANELATYDFSTCARQIFYAVYFLNLFNFIKDMPYDDVDDVLDNIRYLVGMLDLHSNRFQQRDRKYVRVQSIDHMFSIELVLGM